MSKKDDESTKRMNFLVLAAKAYETLDPVLSCRLLKELVQISEKKMIRIDKKLKRRICKTCRNFKPFAQTKQHMQLNKAQQNKAEIEDIIQGMDNQSSSAPVLR